MDSHYKNIAEQCDYFWEEIHRSTTDIVIDKLQLKPQDRLLDLGTGSGQLISYIRDIVDFKNPVTCVEPCESSIDRLRRLDRVIAVQTTAEEFYDELRKKMVGEKMKAPFNKVTIIGAVHHFTDPTACLHNIIDFLPNGGTCLIAERPTDKWSLPFARSHLEDLRSLHTTSYNIAPQLRQRNDAVVEVSDELFSYEMKKEKWYSMIRGRFMSNFHKYTDEELEESIKELEEERFSGVQDDDDIVITDNYVLTKVTKIM